MIRLSRKLSGIRRWTPRAPIWLAGLLAGLFLLPSGVLAAELQEEFNLENDRIREDNILELIFGSAPPMPTQRGILVIDAFYDRNGNGRREVGEDDLKEEVSCVVDDVEYAVPAFIPGLDLDGSYRVDCTGVRFRPKAGEEYIFIRRRGEIIRLDLPCTPLTQSSGNSHQPSTSGK